MPQMRFLMASTCAAQKEDAGKRCPCVKTPCSKMISLPLHTALKFIYLWCHEMPAKEIKHELQISSKTVATFQARLRRVCALEFECCEEIGGLNTIVQVDECHLYTRKSNSGRLLKMRCWVFGGVDENGKIFVERVMHRDASTLTEVLIRRVQPGSIIFSDCWSGYIGVRCYYEHHTVNHKLNFVNPQTGTNTQAIESRWNVLKRFLRRKGPRICNDINSYLAEHQFREAHRDAPYMAFINILERMHNRTA